MSDTDHLHAELERNLLALQFPLDDGAYGVERQRAAEWLLAHADLAYARLLNEASGRTWVNPNAVLALLPRFGREDTIPVLANVLENDSEWVSWNAARALAGHPLDAAREALERGLESQREVTVISAADALLTRADHASCPALRRAAGRPIGKGREHVIQAALQLECLGETELAALRTDPSEAVRELVRRGNTSGRGS